MQIQSPQVITDLTVSGSFLLTPDATGSLVSQITGSLNTLYITTGSITTGDWNTLVNKPAGIVSSSGQVTYSGLSGVPSGIVSSSTQLNSSTLSGMTVSGSFTGSFVGSFPGSSLVSSSSQINNTTLSGMTITGSFNGNGNDLNITGSARTFVSPQRGSVVTDNDGSFDMNVGNNFKCQPTASVTLTFTNITSGQSGFVLLINTGSFTISAAATTKVGTTTLSTLSTSGSYLCTYFTDGTNVFVVNSGGLT